jgi:hypothetical protein
MSPDVYATRAANAQAKHDAGMARLVEAQREIQGEIDRRKAPRRQADLVCTEYRSGWGAWLAGACVAFLVGLIAGAGF